MIKDKLEKIGQIGKQVPAHLPKTTNKLPAKELVSNGFVDYNSGSSTTNVRLYYLSLILRRKRLEDSNYRLVLVNSEEILSDEKINSCLIEAIKTVELILHVDDVK